MEVSWGLGEWNKTGTWRWRCPGDWVSGIRQGRGDGGVLGTGLIS